MSNFTTITVVGNLTADPELRFTPQGAAVANFTVASTPRSFDKQRNEWVDGEAMFLRCSVWRTQAENVAESLERGMRVIVQGRLKCRSYEKDGEKRQSWEIDVEEVGPSLMFATAKVARATRTGGQQQQAQPQQGQPPQAPQGDPWATPSGQQGGWGPPADEPPF